MIHTAWQDTLNLTHGKGVKSLNKCTAAGEMLHYNLNTPSTTTEYKEAVLCGPRQRSPVA